MPHDHASREVILTGGAARRGAYRNRGIRDTISCATTQNLFGNGLSLCIDCCSCCRGCRSRRHARATDRRTDVVVAFAAEFWRKWCSLSSTETHGQTSRQRMAGWPAGRPAGRPSERTIGESGNGAATLEDQESDPIGEPSSRTWKFSKHFHARASCLPSRESSSLTPPA